MKELLNAVAGRMKESCPLEVKRLVACQREDHGSSTYEGPLPMTCPLNCMEM
ncbi:hypothetical protein Dimus_024879, partial [Dionaea muscipula]